MNMLILNNAEALISILLDRAMMFGILFVLLMVGSYTRNSTMDKTSTLSEMIKLKELRMVDPQGYEELMRQITKG